MTSTRTSDFKNQIDFVVSSGPTKSQAVGIVLQGLLAQTENDPVLGGRVALRILALRPDYRAEHAPLFTLLIRAWLHVENESSLERKFADRIRWSNGMETPDVEMAERLREELKSHEEDLKGKRTFPEYPYMILSFKRKLLRFIVEASENRHTATLKVVAIAHVRYCSTREIIAMHKATIA